MPKGEKDLFGHPIKKKKPRLQTILEKYDRDTLLERMLRLGYVQKTFPKKYWFAMSIEAASLFSEAKMAFINGEFISTILLSVSFCEHWLGTFIENKGYPKKDYYTITNIINCLRKNKLISGYLLIQLDRIREIRNPFVHIKEYDNPNNFSQRLFKEKTIPHELLEKDAKEALPLMYQISISLPPG